MTDRGLVVELGPLRIDVPRSIGFYGGIVGAVAVGLIDPPLGVFIACVPLMKMTTNSRAPKAVQWLGQVLDGVAKPVGGDAEGTVRLADPQAALEQAAQTVALGRQAPAATKRKAQAAVAANTDQPDDPAG